MDKALIERLARGADIWYECCEEAETRQALVYRFAALVAEACAKECVRVKNETRDAWPFTKDYLPDHAASLCADAIRAKFKEPSTNG